MELAPLSLSAPFHNYDEHVNEQGAHSGEEKASSLLGLGLEAHQFSRTGVPLHGGFDYAALITTKGGVLLR